MKKEITMWKPKAGNIFYVITEYGEAKSIYCRGDVDVKVFYLLGNVYHTRTFAEMAVELQKIKTKFTRRRFEIEGPKLYEDGDSVFVISPDCNSFTILTQSLYAVTSSFTCRERETVNRLLKEMGDDIFRAFHLAADLKNAGYVV